jgi:molybdopterin-containing oxidoreductase family iron-sulfur binding subunit
MAHNESLDMAALRERLDDETGPAYWQSLQEIAETEAFQDAVEHEFPEGVDEWTNSTSRRRFLRVMGASLALSGVGLSGCGDPPEAEILPYVDPPEVVVPGEPLFFATSFLLAGYAQGVLVESHMGRPTKIEGNPDHPASRGSTNAFMQGSVLDLYDPDRSQNVLFQGTISTWTEFVEAMSNAPWQAAEGRGLRVLTETVTSPTLAAQLRTLLAAYPEARWHQYDPVSRDAEREGIRRARGDFRQAVYHFDQAAVVLSFDDDFLHGQPGSVRYARDFAERRRVRTDATEMNRLYMAESSSTITGAMADHRFPTRPQAIASMVRSVADALGLDVSASPALSDDAADWVDAVVQDLQDHTGSALVTAGPTMPPDIHTLVHQMNEILGGIGSTVEYIPPVAARSENHQASLRALVEDMAAGNVETLVILGGNPAYTAPADVSFGRHLREVPTSVHVSLMVDATSRDCVWHVPRTHYLEGWSDARAYDGTASIVQPLIDPLYAPCRTVHEVTAVLNGHLGTTSNALVQQHWQEQYSGDQFEAFWTEALQLGVVPGTGRSERETPSSVRIGGIRFDDIGANHSPEALRAARQPGSPASPPSDEDVPASTVLPAEQPTDEGAPSNGTVTVIFRPDPTIWDGRFANNGWLQELPKPLTKLVWDNAAIVGPGLADRLDLQNGDVVDLAHDGNVVKAPIWILPGHPDGTATVYLGHGRPHGGRVSQGTESASSLHDYESVGFNAYTIRSSRAPWALDNVALSKTDATYPLVSTQDHHSMEGRELVREAPIERFRENPDFIYDDGHSHDLPSLYPEWEYDGYQWGMAIDTNVCIGCNACVVACQSENSIPVVGKEAVAHGREMHWLKVDRYYKGAIDNPEAYFQPRPCMHCEKAPCEVVCPVYATVHDHEGLNVMVYNRCIGTRYCSNNCPYKVRRFNFLEWNDWNSELSKMQHNPDVTVRSRGVMEKCTYCTQRINAARTRAKKEDRAIRDGEVMTACQQACPTNAIVFGDLNDETEVVRWKEEPHNYGLLAHLGTRPRTTYLAHFRNPNTAVPPLAPHAFELGQQEKIEVEVGRPDEEQ